MRRLLSFFTALFLLAAALGLNKTQAETSSETIPVRLSARFVHAQLPPGYGNEPGSTSSFYSSKLDGVVNTRFVRNGSALQLEFLLPTGSSTPFLNVTWTPGGNAQQGFAGPVQMYLARSEASEQQFNAWMNGDGNVNPTLIIPLQSAYPYPYPPPGYEIPPIPSNFWTNSSQVAAQLFARQCAGGGNQLQKYADLIFEAGALRVSYLQGQGQASLSASLASVRNISASAWSEALSSACGNAHVQLPSTPAPGTSTDLAALSLQPSGTAALDEGISRIGLRVDGLAADGALPRAHARQLTRWLDSAMDDLRLARPESSINNLNQVERHAENWMGSGILSSAGGALLLADTASAIANINQGAFAAMSLPPLEVCKPSSSCSYTTFFVDGRTTLAASERNGSSGRPFKSLTEALARAETLNLCGVELRVLGSTYREDIQVTRHTRIIGGPIPVLQGSIVNSGPYDLQIENIVIEGGGELGAVVVQNSCAKTTIRFVTINRAKRYGIRQRGGSLLVTLTRIVGTVAEPDVIASGTAIYLTGGVKANLGFVDLNENQSGALVAASTGTEVSATGVAASHNWINPFLVDGILREIVGNGIAAVEARSGASLNMSFCQITDSESTGLYVHSGAQAQFNFGMISGTRELAGTCTEGCSRGGYNVRVTQSAQLFMREVTLSDAALAALQIAGDGFATLSNSAVVRNVIGINSQVSGFDLINVTDGVLFQDNDQNIDGLTLPIPAAGGIDPDES